MVKIEEVRSEFLSVCKSLNKDAALMAVSKLHIYDDILQCYSKGQLLFGENHVQEIEKKFPLKDMRPKGMVVCLIGHLQKNKARKVIPLVDRIDSVDSIDLLLLLEKECEKIDRNLDILIEFNSSEEENKSGFSTKEEVIKAAKLVKDLPHITLKGIMTVGPLGNDEERNRVAFKKTREVFEKVKEIIPDCEILSMGMSNDYKIALEEGSNLVRIGTSIFGARNYNV